MSDFATVGVDRHPDGHPVLRVANAWDATVFQIVLWDGVGLEDALHRVDAALLAAGLEADYTFEGIQALIAES